MSNPEPSRPRLFTGIALNREARQLVSEIQELLRESVEGVRWVDPHNFHVTLKFLGWCDPGLVPEILSVLSEAARLLPLRLEIGGAGGFPSDRAARVVWVGAEETTGNLEKMFKMIDRGVRRLGFERESRRYTPHVTIGRARKPVRLDLGGLPAVGQSVSLDVGDIILYRSELKKGGAVYSVLERVAGGQGR